MKAWAVGCAVLMALPAVATAQEVVRKIPLALQLDIHAQGHVSQAKILGGFHAVQGGRVAARKQESDLPESLRKAARDVARGWTFQSPRVHGKPVSGRTFASATMKLLKLDDGTFRLSLEYRKNGPVLIRESAPRFPVSMRRPGHDGVVVMDARIDPDGALREVILVKAFTRAPDHGRAFAKAAEEAIRGWRGMPMQVAGRNVPTRVRIPVYFSTTATSVAAKVSHRQLEEVQALMQSAQSSAPAVTGPSFGEMLALDTPFVKKPSI